MQTRIKNVKITDIWYISRNKHRKNTFTAFTDYIIFSGVFWQIFALISDFSLSNLFHNSQQQTSWKIVHQKTLIRHSQISLFYGSLIFFIFLIVNRREQDRALKPVKILNLLKFYTNNSSPYNYLTLELTRFLVSLITLRYFPQPYLNWKCLELMKVWYLCCSYC